MNDEMSTNTPAPLEFETYSRISFDVEAVEITEENFQQIFDMIGSEIKSDGGKPYILVDRRIVPEVPKVHIGWFMTRMDGNIRCYPPGSFKNHFKKKRDTTIENDSVVNVFGGNHNVPVD